MVSDTEIAKGVETVLRESDPDAVTSLSGVVSQLEAKLGLDLSHKSGFIRDQITFLLRSHPVPKDHFALHPPTQNLLHPHFTLQPPYHNVVRTQQPPPVVVPPPARGGGEGKDAAAGNASSKAAKPSTPTGTKRRGRPGGLNKVCGVTPELQVIVGEPALPRTEIVKQLWAYIRTHNLQDPNNKRKIVCDDALRAVFETDITDMFKMNKLLAKHIIRLDPKQESGQEKKQKVEDEPGKGTAEPTGPHPVIMSDALAKFFGTKERQILQSEALRRVWEYIRANRLEDPLNQMVIHCDAKLQELIGCNSISVLGIQELISRLHLFNP